jgi:hypothetical protein
MPQLVTVRGFSPQVKTLRRFQLAVSHIQARSAKCNKLTQQQHKKAFLAQIQSNCREMTIFMHFYNEIFILFCLSPSFAIGDSDGRLNENF